MYNLHLCKSLSHSTVTTILTTSCVMREQFSSPANEHVFARKGGMLKHLQGPDTSKEIALAAGFSHVVNKYLNATNFRKFLMNASN